MSRQTTGFPVLSHISASEDFDFFCLVFPGLFDAVEDRAYGALSLLHAIKFIIRLDFAVTLSSPDSFLCSLRHHFGTLCRTEMANVKQTQKMIPLVTCEISLGEDVCELFFGVNVFDLDLAFQIDSIEQPIKSNAVGPGNMSHCGTSSLENHLDHCFAVFKQSKKLLDAKIGRLREHGQHYSKH